MQKLCKNIILYFQTLKKYISPMGGDHFGLLYQIFSEIKAISSHSKFPK